jgi:hypothetical protein
MGYWPLRGDISASEEGEEPCEREAALAMAKAISAQSS